MSETLKVIQHPHMFSKEDTPEAVIAVHAADCAEKLFLSSLLYPRVGSVYLNPINSTGATETLKVEPTLAAFILESESFEWEEVAALHRQIIPGLPFPKSQESC